MRSPVFDVKDISLDRGLSAATTYRFVGHLSDVGDRTFARIGGSIDLDEANYRAMCATGGAMFLSEDEFAKLGFTADELQKFTEDYYGELPAEYKEKVAAARKRFKEIQSTVTL